MRTMTIVAIATMLATASAFGQGAGPAGSGTASLPAKPDPGYLSRMHMDVLDQPARRYPPAPESPGSLDLSHQRPDRSVPQRHLRPGRAASGSHRRGSRILQSSGQSSVDGASGAVSLGLM